MDTRQSFNQMKSPIDAQSSQDDSKLATHGTLNPKAEADPATDLRPLVLQQPVHNVSVQPETNDATSAALRNEMKFRQSQSSQNLAQHRSTDSKAHESGSNPSMPGQDRDRALAANQADNDYMSRVKMPRDGSLNGHRQQ